MSLDDGRKSKALHREPMQTKGEHARPRARLRTLNLLAVRRRRRPLHHLLKITSVFVSLSLLLGLGAPVKTAGCQLGVRKALLCVCICRRVDRCLAGERRTGSGQTGRKPSSPSFDEFCLGAVSGVFGSTPTGRIYCSTHRCPAPCSTFAGCHSRFPHVGISYFFPNY